MTTQEREVIYLILECAYSANELKVGRDGRHFPAEVVDRAVEIIEAHPTAMTAAECVQAAGDDFRW